MGLLCMLALWSKMCYIGLWIHWFHDHNATISNGIVTIRRMSLVGVGHSGSDPIVPLILRTVYFHAMVGAPALYYRSLGYCYVMFQLLSLNPIVFSKVFHCSFLVTTRKVFSWRSCLEGTWLGWHAVGSITS